MISLFGRAETAEMIEFRESLHRAVALMIEGIALHAICDDEDHYSEFRKVITALRERFHATNTDSGEILVIAGAVLQALSLYNREVARRHTAADHEFRTLICMMAEALGYACRGQERVTAGLRALEKKMESAGQADDLRSIKMSLEACLASVKTEIDRQDHEHRELRELAERVTRSAGGSDPVSTDPVTRLPDRTAARAVLASAFELSTSDACGVCLRLDRLPSINSSCGYEAGNEYLLRVSQLIGRSLPSIGRLYRWSGPGFLMFARDVASADQFQRGIERLNATREGFVLTAGSRSIAVGISISTARYAVREWTDLDSFMAQVDAFVSASAQQPQAKL